MKENPAHLAAYTFHYFFLFATLAALLPFYPLLLQNKGFSPSTIGYIMGSYEMCSIAGLMILGHFFDRIQSPRRTITTIGLICITVLFLITRTTQPLLLILLTLVLGFCLKSPTSLMDALYGQTMKQPQESYGKVRLAGSLGFFIVAMTIHITGIVQGNRPRSVFLAYSLLLTVALIAMLKLPTAQLHKKEEEEHLSFINSLRSFQPIFWVGLSIAFLNSLGMSGHYTFFSLMLKNKFHMPEVGGLWAIGPLFEIPLFFFSGYLLKKLSLKKLWMICLAAGIIRMQVYSLASSLMPLYLVQVLHSFSFALNHLCMITLITHTTSVSTRGLAMSLYTAIGMGLSLFTGGILGGFILKISDYHILYQMFSFFPFLGVCINLIFLKGYKEITSTS